VHLHTFFTSSLDGVSGQLHAPAVLLPSEEAQYLMDRGWVGHRARLDAVAKRNIMPCREWSPSRPVLSLVTVPAVMWSVCIQIRFRFVIIVLKPHAEKLEWYGKNDCKRRYYLHTVVEFLVSSHSSEIVSSGWKYAKSKIHCFWPSHYGRRVCKILHLLRSSRASLKLQDVAYVESEILK
jgi:hypothetical protein